MTMILRLLPALFLAMVLAGPGQAAGPPPEDKKKAEEEEIDPEQAALPRSMRRHGVIGRTELPGKQQLTEPELLARMRARLVMQIEAPSE